MIVLSTEIQERLAPTNTPEGTKSALIRLAVALETRLEAVERRLEQRNADMVRVKDERDRERQRRVELELRLRDAETHRDSLAGILERRRLEREQGVEAPMFNHDRDNRERMP